MPMNELQPDINNRIAFIADAHLGMPGDNPDHSLKVASFIEWLRGRISHLYIVGDLFDFWFEYGSVIPNTSPEVIFELYNLVKSGTKVMIFGGNHDYWLGSYIKNNVGLQIMESPSIVEHQGFKIFIHHGDGLYPKDKGYRIMKKVLRSPLSISFFRLIHPDMAAKIAQITSKTSRNHLAPKEFELKNTEAFREIADNLFLTKGIDAFVSGHSHAELIEKRNSGTLVLLGDWIHKNTYVILENKEFFLKNWVYH